jgi:hypothetical protein
LMGCALHQLQLWQQQLGGMAGASCSTCCLCSVLSKRVYMTSMLHLLQGVYMPVYGGLDSHCWPLLCWCCWLAVAKRVACTLSCRLSVVLRAVAVSAGCGVHTSVDA